MPFIYLGCLRRFGIIIGLLVLLGSCTSTETANILEQNQFETSTPIVITPVISESDPLNDTQWKLVFFSDQEKTLAIPEDAWPTIQFNDGALLFYIGCNELNGYYELDNQRITIMLSESSVMDCTDRLGAKTMAIEERFYNVMQTFESYSVEGNELRIYHVDGELLFHRIN